MSKSTAWGLVLLFWCALFLLAGCDSYPKCDGHWRGWEHQRICEMRLEAEWRNRGF